MLNNDRCPYCGMKKKRTSSQNRIYWALLNMIAEQLPVKGQGYTANTWHAYLVQRYLGCNDIILPNGKVVTMPVSTSTLTNEEFGEYFEKCMAWGAEHGVTLPDIEGNI